MFNDSFRLRDVYLDFIKFNTATLQLSWHLLTAITADYSSVEKRDVLEVLRRSVNLKKADFVEGILPVARSIPTSSAPLVHEHLEVLRLGSGGDILNNLTLPALQELGIFQSWGRFASTFVSMMSRSYCSLKRLVLDLKN